MVTGQQDCIKYRVSACYFWPACYTGGSPSERKQHATLVGMSRAYTIKQKDVFKLAIFPEHGPDGSETKRLTLDQELESHTSQHAAATLIHGQCCTIFIYSLNTSYNSDAQCIYFYQVVLTLLIQKFRKHHIGLFGKLLLEKIKDERAHKQTRNLNPPNSFSPVQSNDDR